MALQTMDINGGNTGKKSIRNSPNPRNYYKCTNPRCSAKKQVERSRDDPDTLIVTYEGLHLHFAYPYFPLNNQPFQDDSSPTRQFQKLNHRLLELHKQQKSKKLQQFILTMSQYRQSHFKGCPQEIALKGFSQEGLVEDVVPWMIRNPSHNNNISSRYSPCSSSQSRSSLLHLHCLGPQI